MRSLTRYAVGLLAGLLAGARVVDAARAWLDWHQWAIADPSAADLYRDTFWIDVTVAAFILAIAALVYWLLRPGVVANGARVAATRDP